MHILIVDDEALARTRLRSLLADCPPGPDGLPHHVCEAQNADQAMALLQSPGPRPVDLVLLDIHMPGRDGLALAHALRRLNLPPVVVFVTAHPSHALQAFELDAADYLTKPVRRERLQQALAKALRALALRPAAALDSGPTLLIQERHTTVRLPLTEVLYLKAEQKYVTVRTLNRNYVLDGALAELESRHADQLLRVHRNALVARTAMRSLERQENMEGREEGDAWGLSLHGIPELLTVSRRQLPLVRAALRSAMQEA
ncbi:LytR/AlgR family response regulator transcription factor [Comamonas composti]|uniref:LytR/AlgR family response regulator transcription factor n=1 Tax=Comamonas composti TaxID=408558 RepID=UPI0004070646|nr:LytTR family DNA-binding domain-containing protein [Comamonas composti]